MSTSLQDQLPRSISPSLRHHAVTPTHAGYDRLRSTYSEVGAPAVILRPGSVAEVKAAVDYARRDPRPLAVRSGGHGIGSTNHGGIVIDTSRLKNLNVIDPYRRVVRVGAGARWGNVARQLDPFGLAISSGDHGNVGVGGLAAGGGIGWLARSQGLAIDNIVGATVVLADGSVVRVDEHHEPELFWGLRGAGGLLGVVTSFDFVAAPVREVGIARLRVSVDREGAVLSRWAEVMASAPREMTSFVTVLPSLDGPAAEITAVISRPELLRGLAARLHRVGHVVGATREVIPYAALLPDTDLQANVGQQTVIATNGLVEELTPGLASRLMSALGELGSAVLQLRSVDGAVHDMAPDRTAYAHRHQRVAVVLAAFPPADAAQLDSAWAQIEPHTDGAYRNFESRPHTDSAFRRAFPGETGERLRRLQADVDPAGIFRTPQLTGTGSAPRSSPTPRPLQPPRDLVP
jgi:FAD/FMN-containing dehydrogenase